MKKTAILLVLMMLFLIGCSAESSANRDSEPEVTVRKRGMDSSIPLKF